MRFHGFSMEEHESFIEHLWSFHGTDNNHFFLIFPVWKLFLFFK
jgi:hypothetical protein